jgi:hypothetical protein
VVLDRIPIDVSRLVDQNVASLYSYLVTRPTGRAVRLAIESRLVETSGTALFLIDLSEVTVLDFSCADEVVAKLLLRCAGPDRPAEVFFVFRGVQDSHLGPIEVVLRRHDLAAVAETDGGGFELLGTGSEGEFRIWSEVESRGRIERDQVGALFPEEADRFALQRLAARRLVFERPDSGDYHALSRLIRLGPTRD